MTSISTDFDAAIDQALALSEKLEGALSVLRELTSAMARSVANRTDGLVVIKLVPVESFTTNVGGLFYAVEKLRGYVKQREIGEDQEDRQIRQFVVASVRGAREMKQMRVLWEVAIEGRSGFPIAVHGPEEDEELTCFSEVDIREAFLAAAGHGLVGRKIASLYAYAKRQSEAEAATAQVEPGATVAKDDED